jgi:bisphosphoglycerate-independent phosphoglycerate mutase (AlkP superfamily)
MPSPWGGVRWDAFTHHYALEYLKKNAPKVVYISYGETDDFAHDGNYEAYLKSALQTDKFIESLWNWTQSQPQYKNKTTFIITTDHGRGTIPLDTWRSHGTEIDGADQIWFAVIGPDTEGKGEMKEPGQYYQNQVAKTAAAFLKVDFQTNVKAGEVVKSMVAKDEKKAR